MPSMILVVPTRGRPDNAKRLADRVAESQHTCVTFVVDDNDPALDEYIHTLGSDLVGLVKKGRPGIVDPLNTVATQLAERWDYIGFLGDDHLPQTPDWDTRIIEVLDEFGTGIVYGNDLLQGEALPTAVFMTSDIIRTLGYMAPPQLNHLFVDNYWLELGRGIGHIEYLEDVVIEHLHPLNGKSEWDATYSHCNDNAAPKDGFIWQALLRGGYIDRDVEKVKAIL